ncbi:MAG: hypothetical protein JF599_14160 [Verrucomicrobia bacterium]|nr:hypothetical protein [Verrucomicrobiota bacterium]
MLAPFEQRSVLVHAANDGHRLGLLCRWQAIQRHDLGIRDVRALVLDPRQSLQRHVLAPVGRIDDRRTLADDGVPEGFGQRHLGAQPLDVHLVQRCHQTRRPLHDAGSVVVDDLLRHLAVVGAQPLQLGVLLAHAVKAPAIGDVVAVHEVWHGHGRTLFPGMGF